MKIVKIVYCILRTLALLALAGLYATVAKELKMASIPATVAAIGFAGIFVVVKWSAEEVLYLIRR